MLMPYQMVQFFLTQKTIYMYILVISQECRPLQFQGQDKLGGNVLMITSGNNASKNEYLHGIIEMLI